MTSTECMYNMTSKEKEKEKEKEQVVALGGLDDNIIEKANDINPYTDKEIPVIGILTGIPGE